MKVKLVHIPVEHIEEPIANGKGYGSILA